jgi:hypothetical protein
VRQWVANSFPIVVVDEAQDLSPERSRLIAALAPSVNLILAFDEFQCLDPDLRPMAVAGWLDQYCNPTALDGCHRTDSRELIAAAIAVRNGHAVNDGRSFRVRVTPGQPEGLAATWLASTIRYRNGGGSVAVLTPSRQGGFANRAIARVCAQPVGQRGHGPFKVLWERGEDVGADELINLLGFDGRQPVGEVLTAMAAHKAYPEIRSVCSWLLRQRRTRDLHEVATAEIHRQLTRAVAFRRRYCEPRGAQLAGMTIQQAKNREFEHVVVLWPFRVPDNDEQRRRLLYNAITRAMRSCTILVQGEALLEAPPFVPRVPG